MANKHKQNTQKPTDYLERPEALQQELSKTEHFFKTNQKVVFILGGIIALAIAGIFGYKYYTNQQDETAQKEMFQAVYYFEAEDYEQALNGDGMNYGFLDIIENYGMAEAANLAHYYAGVSFIKQGQFQEGIDHLKQFSSSDLLVQARANALIGDAFMQLEQYGNAADYYGKAADNNENKFFTPQYLMKKAVALEKQENYSAAADAYAQIVNNYPTSYEFQEARKHQARLEALATK
jgi:predicted negative regulator of RcsB-dependent stress response